MSVESIQLDCYSSCNAEKFEEAEIIERINMPMGDNVSMYINDANILALLQLFKLSL